MPHAQTAAVSIMDDSFDLGTRLRALRLNKGYTLRGLARRAGCSASFLSQIELNQGSPTVAHLKKICRALQFPISDVLREDVRLGEPQVGSAYKQQIYGTEWDLSYQPDKHFYSTLSYSYAYSHDIDPGFIHETNSTYLQGTTTTTDVGSFVYSGFPLSRRGIVCSRKPVKRGVRTWGRFFSKTYVEDQPPARP
jgi:transcriptional regulator with XRE-family HTH domain